MSAAFCVLLLGAFSQSASGASIGAGNPYPVSHYKCEDGTQLAVRLFGDRASVSVNGNAAIDLPSIGKEGTTYSNGRQTLTIIQGRLSWGVGRAVPSACKGG
ncbi:MULTISPECIES: hypothetical protein [Brucella/Ochrobactrum group]|uniref:hypothetical protein n=1 Tax=Brucella/Ochrobactrum group TaxID=2826938 RepID=UPI00045173F4|nr:MULTISPECIES: hypothetical protein [Brucella/Ochrobactrum group]MCR5942242.1 hypothetical protein [Ochrobactrum sp. XJ1]EXL03166.1 hypothetical protein BG46_05115 [Brucella anthropi]KAB2746344.1 hypothetical protein F9K95_22720 [Brucella anthropi]KAB2777666.1 hypothetical protein F9L00_13170 [Brucella anthropi]KIU66347.1 hypothetical protein TR92_19115 [Brucella anthropi]